MRYDKIYPKSLGAQRNQLNCINLMVFYYHIGFMLLYSYIMWDSSHFIMTQSIHIQNYLHSSFIHILISKMAIIDSVPNFVDLPSLNHSGFNSLYNDSDSIHS